VLLVHGSDDSRWARPSGEETATWEQVRCMGIEWYRRERGVDFADLNRKFAPDARRWEATKLHARVCQSIVLHAGVSRLCVSGVFRAGGGICDRKLHAKLQQRIGPPWFQPLADIIKLAAKEDLMPESADRWMFKLTPLGGAGSTVTAFIYIPVWSRQAKLAFEGDVIVVLYLLTISDVHVFSGGWYSALGVFDDRGGADADAAFRVMKFRCLSPFCRRRFWRARRRRRARRRIAWHFNWSLSGMSAFNHDHPRLRRATQSGFLWR